MINYGAFAQDHWSITPKLTLDLGIRYDFEQLPVVFNRDTNNFSPRVGLAYQILPSWVMRAGYGLFYDRYVLASLNRVLQKNGAQAFEHVLDGGAAASVFQNAQRGSLQSPIEDLQPSVYRADARLATPYSQQASFGLEHQIARDLTATASYLFVQGVKLSRTRNINLLPSESAVFGPARMNPLFNGIYQLENSAHSTYQGVSLAVNRRISNELEF